MPSNHVFVIGSFIMGLTIRIPRKPVPGESLMGTGLDLGPGGKGFNLAMAIKRAGGSVGLMLCIGNDMFGQFALDTLAQENFPTQFIYQVNEWPTGCGFVTLMPSGENSIVIDAGANQSLTIDLLYQAEEVIKSSSILVAQLEVPPAVVEEAMVLGKKHGCLTILNPAPACLLSARTLAHVDILTPNETEARVLVDLPPDADVTTKILVQRLLALGPRAIVITRGKQGAWVATEDGIHEIASPSIQLVDSTGAGDAFNGTMAYQLAQGQSLQEAVRRAVYAGAFCAGKLGVINGLPTTPELEEFIQHHYV